MFWWLLGGRIIAAGGTHVLRCFVMEAIWIFAFSEDDSLFLLLITSDAPDAAVGGQTNPACQV